MAYIESSEGYINLIRNSLELKGVGQDIKIGINMLRI